MPPASIMRKRSASLRYEPLWAAYMRADKVFPYGWPWVVVAVICSPSNFFNFLTALHIHLMEHFCPSHTPTASTNNTSNTFKFITARARNLTHAHTQTQNRQCRSGTELGFVFLSGRVWLRVYGWNARYLKVEYKHIKALFQYLFARGWPPAGRVCYLPHIPIIETPLPLPGGDKSDIKNHVLGHHWVMQGVFQDWEWIPTFPLEYIVIA